MTDTPIPVITLWQPWASWVMLGWKTIETRTHARFASLRGKTIGIHASVRWDKDALELARPYLSTEQYVRSANFLKIGGAILGTCHVADFRPLLPQDAKHSLIECETKRFGLVLTDPTIIEAVPIKGKQGIWYWRGN